MKFIPTIFSLAPRISLFAALCALPFAPTTVWATPISASMGFEVKVDFTPFGTKNVARDSASWGVLTSPLSVHTEVTNTAPNGSTARTFGGGSATWAPGGNSGAVTIDYGWSAATHDVTTGLATVSTDPLYGNNWSYTFMADATGNFVMNYHVAGSGSPATTEVPYPMFGLIGFDLIANAFYPSGPNFFDPTASGQVTQAVLAGNVYTMVIRNSGNTSGSQFTHDAAVHATFDWTMPGGESAVPDGASTVALLGFSLGALSVVRRRWVA